MKAILIILAIMLFAAYAGAMMGAELGAVYVASYCRLSCGDVVHMGLPVLSCREHRRIEQRGQGPAGADGGEVFAVP